jgi:hypothetical protein
VWWLRVALRRPQEKHAPGVLEHVQCVFFVICFRVFVVSWYPFVGFKVSQQGACVAAACGALPTSENTPLGIRSMYIVDSIIFDEESTGNESNHDHTNTKFG